MDEHIVISTSADLLRIAAAELVYAEADGNYTTLMLTDGERRVVTMQLGQLEKLIASQMPQAAQRFARIGKSLIVKSVVCAISIRREGCWNCRILQDRSMNSRPRAKRCGC